MRVPLNRLHSRIRSADLAQRFTLLVRTALAVGFVAPGLTKVLGAEFAPGIDPDSIMGAYFVAFHAVGPYYVFVGVAQVAAGAFLLSRRTSLLGAVLYFPTILNIAVLTVAARFGIGTPTVTVLMALACLWLLVWDGHRLVPVLNPALRSVPERSMEPAVWDLFVPRAAPDRAFARRALRTAYVVGLAGVIAFTVAARGLLPPATVGAGLAAFVAAGLLTVAGWALHALGPSRPPTAA